MDKAWSLDWLGLTPGSFWLAAFIGSRSCNPSDYRFRLSYMPTFRHPFLT